MGIGFLLIMTIIPLIFSVLVIFIIEELVVTYDVKCTSCRLMLKIIWIILFLVIISYLFYFKESFVLENSSLFLGGLTLLTLAAPLDFLGLLILNLISIIFNIEFNNIFLYVILFISGYYQWFIWFPKYLIRKKIKKLIKNGYTDEEIIEKLSLMEHNKEDIDELRKWVKVKNGDK